MFCVGTEEQGAEQEDKEDGGEAESVLDHAELHGDCLQVEAEPRLEQHLQRPGNLQVILTPWLLNK